MSQHIDSEEMKFIGRTIKELLGPNIGFALFTFDFNKPGISNYISNANREDMIKAMEETLQRFKGGTDFPTPAKN